MHCQSKRPFPGLGVVLVAVFLAAQASAQVGGSLIELPPKEIDLEITETADGKPVISTHEIRLTTGEYYRLNVTSRGETDWRFEMPEMLQNAHLRLVTVNDGIEVHLQALMFRAIEFDRPGKIAVSFTPIQPGSFAFTIGRNPIAQGLPRGQAGMQEKDRRAEGRFIVE